jgi:2-polyprenyl-6-hydroxyphenyl methylase/3-demethylubiquinone-9 3-methyltransferase
MSVESRKYPADHWLLGRDPETALSAYLDQQSKAYSRMKNMYIKELLGDLKDKRFLDYGCGAGFFSVYAAQQGAREVIGIDQLESALETAAFFARREGVFNICRFFKDSGFPRDMGRRKFDAILMKDVVEHVVNDQDLLVAAHEALKPGGILVLSTQNRISLNYLFQGTYHRYLLKNKDWYGWDETHLRFYSPMSLNRQLRHAGFLTVTWRSVYIVPYKLPAFAHSKKKFIRIDALSHVDRILGGIFPYNRLGWNVVVRAVASTLVKTDVAVPFVPEPETSSAGPAWLPAP